MLACRKALKWSNLGEKRFIESESGEIEQHKSNFCSFSESYLQQWETETARGSVCVCVCVRVCVDMTERKEIHHDEGEVGVVRSIVSILAPGSPRTPGSRNERSCDGLG